MTAARSLRRYVERASRPVLLQPATPPPGTRPPAAPKTHPKAPVEKAKPESVGKTTPPRSPKNNPEIPAPTAPEMNQFEN